MPALILLFAVLGVPMQADWLVAPQPRLECHTVFVWDYSSPEALAEAEARDDKQVVRMCWEETR